ncbi:GNAT family N-acetyltransferase [Labedaea rhizosphaerae]|uniref:Putative hemolysin n=1 Tax=Labedaea rhizosphaerae TaxID=598644 RepID=A0A4R6SER8_LABRH|nr:GNAT family N-acyltransferase [Labedaea rhizosphaerae]TDP97546.1 putative hemolysin [Labedaea rhizosphaerae]
MVTTQVLATTPDSGAGTARYSLLVARDSDEVTAAQRLRHAVFAGELGATLHSPVPGLDVDAFDEYCDHLVVRADDSGEIVGTYRMLPPGRAGAGLYSETEFDLGALAPLRDGLVETGRSCVHPDHRSGAVIGLVWAGIARYMVLSGHSWLGGCASVPLADGGSFAKGVWQTVRAKHYAPDEYRVTPHRPWNSDVEPPVRTVLPPLLKGYLRLGAWVCGPPAHDPDFAVADLFVLLGMSHVDQRYLRFFLGETG